MKYPITPCLWFDNQAEEAVGFYMAIFKNSTILAVSRYTEAGFEIHGQPAGTVMSINFQLNGQTFNALNGGPIFKFTEAISLQVYCDTQEELDHYWNALTSEGEEGNCGWLKDKYGLSWQIIPSVLPELMSNPEKAGRVANAFMKMKKMDIQTLINA